MGQRGRFAVGAAFGIGLMVASTGIAHAAGDTFTVSTTTVHRGAAIVVRSSTPCTLPAGVTGDPVVKVALVRGSAVLDSESVKPESGGAWSARLTVLRTSDPGAAQVTAFCLASEQAEGAILAYDPVDVTVTGELAMTGGPTRPLAATGLGVLLLGLALAAAAAVTRRDGRWSSSPSR
jgi:hypothetical protein